eukprot:1161005-Pelagomonas_calceolata.AAC.4
MQSKAPGIEKGKFYSGMVPWTSPQIATKAQMEQMQPVDTDILKLAKLPLSGYAGVFGLTGMTAKSALGVHPVLAILYASLTRIGKPKKGETVFVSGAAGAWQAHGVGKRCICELKGETVFALMCSCAHTGRAGLLK